MSSARGEGQDSPRLPKPSWLKTRIPSGENYFSLKKRLADAQLPTICQSGRCPNIAECWHNHQATFLIMGERCTRQCAFCSVTKGQPSPLNPKEAQHIWEVANILGSQYLVITSVTRDDLPDFGSGHFSEVIRFLKTKNPMLKVEALIPDFQGKTECLDRLITAKPDVIAHNLETVANLYPLVSRRKACYDISMNVLAYVKKKGCITKTGIMVGLGESAEDLRQLFVDLSHCGIDILTIGQYLQPTLRNISVTRYYSPQEFSELRNQARTCGIKTVEAGPFVRSSFHSEQSFKEVCDALPHF